MFVRKKDCKKTSRDRINIGGLALKDLLSVLNSLKNRGLRDILILCATNIFLLFCYCLSQMCDLTTILLPLECTLILNPRNSEYFRFVLERVGKVEK